MSISPPVVGVAFLLSQVGAHAGSRFAGRVGELGLSPAQVGVLRQVAQQPGLSQQALATALGIVPSTVVTLIDELEARDLVERRRSPADRRNHALHLTDAAGAELAQIRSVVQAHERDVTQALSADERYQLSVLLRKVADQQGLAPGAPASPRRLA